MSGNEETCERRLVQGESVCEVIRDSSEPSPSSPKPPGLSLSLDKLMSCVKMQVSSIAWLAHRCSFQPALYQHIYLSQLTIGLLPSLNDLNHYETLIYSIYLAQRKLF